MANYIDGFIYDLIPSYSEGSNYATIYNGLYYGNSVNGSTLENMYLLRDATGIRNQTVGGLSGTLSAANSYGTKRPRWCLLSIDPGMGTRRYKSLDRTRSYVQGVTTFGTGCVGMKVDGDPHNGGNDPTRC